MIASNGGLAAGHISQLFISPQSQTVDNLPILIGSPPREADCFQARSEGGRLAQALTTADASTATCLLVGPGGVGKSQLAAHYVRNSLTQRSVDVIIWASANSRESVQSSYAKAINALTGEDSSDTEGAATRFIAWTHTTDRRWLVVLDDLTTPSTLRGLWPPASKSGKVLVTTRRRDAALSGTRWCRIPVGLFNANDSVRYLTNKLRAGGHAIDLQELRYLAEDLDHLPLALAQSAAYLIDSGLDCLQYREALADRRRSLQELLPDTESLPDDHNDIVTATWSLSMEQANSLAPHGLARPVLEIAAVLNPDGCPRQVFTTSTVREYVETCIDNARDQPITEAHIKATLRNLHKLSLIDDDASATAGTEIRMHALVQRAVVETLREEPYEQVIQVAADGLLEVWPNSLIQSDLIQALRANAEFMRNSSMPQLLSDSCHELLYRHGESLTTAGLASAAVEHFVMLRITAENFDPDHPDIVFLTLALGDALEEAGQVSDALKEYRKLLRDELKRNGSDDEGVLHVRSVLAECLGRAGDAKGSVRAFEELLRDRVRIHGPDHELTFDTRRRLVSARSHAGDVAGAIATCQELLADELRVHGRDHPHTRHTQMHLADEIGASGDVNGAIKMLEGLLLQVTKVHGKHHEGTFSIRHHLARWYADDGRYPAAIETVRFLLEDEKETLGESHPSVLDLQSHLADYIGVAGKPEQALAISQEIFEKHLLERGREHPDTLDARGMVAHWKGRSGNFTEAARDYSLLLSDCEAILGPDHLMTVRMVGHLASALRQAGNMRESLLAFERLASDRERIHGCDDPRTLTARDYLAYQLLLIGEDEKALKVFKNLHADQARLLGEDHPDTLHSREHIEELER